MESVSKYYHTEKRRLEEQEHAGRFESGREVLIGATYKGILLRYGRSVDGPFTALRYEDGTLLLGSKDYHTFVFITVDVTDVDGYVYTEDLNIISIRENLHDLLKEGDRIMDLRRAASYKMFWPLSESGAGMIIRWWDNR